MAKGKTTTEGSDIEVVENKVETPTSKAKALKRFIEPTSYKVNEKTGDITPIKFEIEGRSLTFIGSRPKADRKCLWDKTIPGDENSPDIPLEEYKDLPGYDAMYAKIRFTNMNKRTLDAFLVKTSDELHLYQIDG